MALREDEIEALAPPAAWVDLTAAPPGCPWARPSASEPAAIVRAVFAPVAERAKSLVSELERRCVALRAAQLDGQWRLLYAVRVGKKQGRLSALVGGAPDAAPVLSAAAQAAGWGLSAELRDFYAVHNGFGPFAEGRWAVEAVLPSQALEVLPAVVGAQFDAARTPIVDPNGFLAFMVDGAGNRRGHYRQFGGAPYARAMDWDHETQRVGAAAAALAVISREMVRWMREG